MSKANTVSPLRQRMIEDMAARKLGPQSQRSHIQSCRRFAAFLKRSPDMATADDVRRFQLHLVEAGLGISNRNRIMTGVRFLFRITLRRHDLAAEIYHLLAPLRLHDPDDHLRAIDVASLEANDLTCTQPTAIASSTLCRRRSPTSPIRTRQ